MIVVIGLVMTVDILLLTATAKLLAIRCRFLPMAAAVVLDAAFMTLSCLPELQFMKQFLFRLAAVLLTGLTAFGFSPGSLVFALLALSLGEVTDSKNEILPILFGASGLVLACLVLAKQHRYVPVELTRGSKTLYLTALRDTGNHLHDPITGKPVLIVDGDTAWKLTGLTPDRLRDPIGSIGTMSGLRLIPYQTVGGSGFLLALPISQAKIGNRRGSVLVAMSPQILSTHYQALTGGSL